MRIITTALLLQCCVAAPPGAPVVDRAFKVVMRGDHRKDALELLMNIAEGKDTAVVRGAAVRVGLGAYIQDPAAIANMNTRRYAVQKIGQTDLAEAIEFLRDQAQRQHGAEDSRTIYPDATLALQKALFRRETDDQHRIAFLEEILKGPGFLVHLWAADELCNRGSKKSLPLITDFISHAYAGSAVGEMVKSCEARMDIVNRSPDLATALGTALHIDVVFEDRDLLTWLINQLMALNSPAADRTLEDYVQEVERNLPDIPTTTSDLQKGMHRGAASRIRSMLDARRRMQDPARPGPTGTSTPR